MELIALTGSDLVLAEVLSEAKKYLDLLTFKKTSHSADDICWNFYYISQLIVITMRKKRAISGDVELLPIYI